MKRSGLGFLIAMMVATGWAQVADANAIRRACLKSDRQAASRSLCSCIQDAADATLNRSEQQRGARFFANPQALQDLRQSSSSSNSRFWKNWKNFGVAAKNYCN